jgi:hypothetical protein
MAFTTNWITTNSHRRKEYPTRLASVGLSAGIFNVTLVRRGADWPTRRIRHPFMQWVMDPAEARDLHARLGRMLESLGPDPEG